MANQSTEGLLSPFLRRQRFKAATPYIKGRVLDIGCGGGALASIIESELYYGYDVDNDSLATARKDFPKHNFYDKLPSKTESFDTVVALAVIEHVHSSSDFLISLKEYLRDDQDARIVCTTPHPSLEWAHDFGAKLGIFSKHANEEHEELLDYQKLKDAAEKSILKLDVYRKFLFGANQLAVYRSY